MKLFFGAELSSGTLALASESPVSFVLRSELLEASFYLWDGHRYPVSTDAGSQDWVVLPAVRKLQLLKALHLLKR